MLVSFHKGFMMEGETTLDWRPHIFCKKEKIRDKIYLYTGISGVCDETELEAEVDRLTKKQLSSSGWGEDFSGWQRVVPYEEVFERAKAEGWQKATLPSFKLMVESVRDWTVVKAIEKLTGKQFAQYCRDCGITQKDVIKIKTI